MNAADRKPSEPAADPELDKAGGAEGGMPEGSAGGPGQDQADRPVGKSGSSEKD